MGGLLCSQAKSQAGARSVNVYGINAFGNLRARRAALEGAIAPGATLIMVGDYLTATVRALEDTTDGLVAAVGGCLDDIVLPSDHEGFGVVEWQESWLQYLQEHRVALVMLPGAPPTSAGATTASIIRSYNRASEVLAASIRKVQSEQRRAAKKEAGGYICGRPPYGYLVKGGSFVVNGPQSRAVTFIFEELRKGSTLADLIASLKRKHATGGIIAGKQQFWDRVKIRRILSHARLYCLGQYHGGRGEPLHLPDLAFLPAEWIDTQPPTVARAAS